MKPIVAAERGVCKEQGSILIEVMVSILIFAFGLLGIIGLQANSIRATADAKYRADASHIANKVISDMWLDRTNLGGFAAAGVSEPGLPEGKRTVTVNGAQVQVTLTWRAPGKSTDSNIVVVAQISG